MEKIKFVKPEGFEHAVRQLPEKIFQRAGDCISGGARILNKSIFIMAGFIISYLLMFWPYSSPAYALIPFFFFIQFSILMAFNIMHDGGHGTFSRSKKLNSLAAHSLDLLGGSSFLWKIKHNQNHHTYTNIVSYDDDIDTSPLIRLSPEHPYYRMHRYQHIYAPVLYMFVSLNWIFYADPLKLHSGQIGSIKFRVTKKDIFRFYFFKALYFIYTLAIPMLFFSPLTVIGCFLLGHFIFGFTIGMVFQMAHTLENTSFSSQESLNSSNPSSWVRHQLATTCNFACNNRFVSFYCGGLNFQVEHHLFSRISHIHYPTIRPHLKQLCNDFQVNYLENRTFYHSVKSHFAHLKNLSKRPAKNAVA